MTSYSSGFYLGATAAPARSTYASTLSTLAGGQLAGRGQRLGAVAVDGAAGLVAVLPFLLVIAIADPGGQVVMLSIASAVCLALGITQICLLVRCGQTIGKKAVGVRIVNHGNGSNAGFWRVIGLRYFLCGLIAGIPLVGSIFWLTDTLFIFGPERRCLHDLIADTKVIQAR